MTFRKLTLKGISIDDFKETFGFSKRAKEKEDDALFRIAKANKRQRKELKRKVPRKK